MVRQEQRISNAGGEERRESTKKMKPVKVPQRGPGIAVLEMLRRDEPLKMFSDGKELISLPLLVPTLSVFDSKSSLGNYLQNFNIHLHQLLDSSPLLWDEGTAPLLPSSPNSQLFAGATMMKEAPRVLPLPIPSLSHQQDNQQQISQAMNNSPLFSDSGACLQKNLEPSSIQSRYGIVNESSWTDQQMMMHQIVGMKRTCPFQTDPSKNQRVNSPEHIHIPHPNCGAMVFGGMLGKTTDCLTDGTSKLKNVEGNLDINHPTTENNTVFGEAAPFDEGIIDWVCSPSAVSSTWCQRTRSFQLLPKGDFLPGQTAEENPAPQESQVFFNFIGLHHTDCAFDPHVIANHIEWSSEGSDAVDIELKL